MSSNDVYVKMNRDGGWVKAGPASPPLSARTVVQDGVHGSNDRSQNAMAKRKLLQASAICAVFMVIEIFAGIYANSLALITDASHLLSDLSSFLISLFALWVSDLPGTHQLSFGYHRAEILGALISVMLIWALTIFLVVEAFNRFRRPQPVNGPVMFLTAFVGTIANIVMTYMLGVHSHGIGSAHTHDEHEGCGHHHNHESDAHHSHSEGIPRKSQQIGDMDNGIEGLRHSSLCPALEEPLVHYHGSKNVNLRAAYVHAVGDLIQNVGVLVASGLIWWNPGWAIADPLCTFLFSILVLTTTVSILKEATNVLMEGTPSEVDLPDLRSSLARIENVSEVHDLHVWSLSVGKPSLACHIVVDSEEEARRVLRQATYICQQEFDILHTTIQIDFSANKLACDTNAHSKCH